jgi:Domain of unknown function DUF11
VYRGGFFANFIPTPRTKGGIHMTTNTAGPRRIPLWTIVVLGLVACMVLLALVVAVSGPTQAQSRSASDLHVNKKPKRAQLTVGKNFTWTVRVKNERGSIARDVVMVDDLPNFVRFVRASTSLHHPGICRPFGTNIVECRLGDLRVGNSVRIDVTAKAFKAGSGKNRVHAHAARASGAGFGSDLQNSDNSDTTRHTAVRR